MCCSSRASSASLTHAGTYEAHGGSTASGGGGGMTDVRSRGAGGNGAGAAAAAADALASALARRMSARASGGMMCVRAALRQPMSAEVGVDLTLDASDDSTPTLGLVFHMPVPRMKPFIWTQPSTSLHIRRENQIERTLKSGHQARHTKPPCPLGHREPQTPIIINGRTFLATPRRHTNC